MGIQSVARCLAGCLKEHIVAAGGGMAWFGSIGFYRWICVGGASLASLTSVAAWTDFAAWASTGRTPWPILWHVPHHAL